MLAERLRFPWMSVLIVVPLTVIPAMVHTSASVPQSTICLELPIAESRVPAEFHRDATGPSPRVVADALYRNKDFHGAANAARAEDRNLAELYDQLGRAWAISFDLTSTPADAFPALREAWKLDTVLGGAFTDLLYAKTREIAPLAAEQYTKQHRDEEAIQAANTALTLGHEVYR